MKRVSKLGVVAVAAMLAAGLSVPAASGSTVRDERRAAAYKPTLKANDVSVVAGKKLVLSGKVKPATKGGEVVLQKKLGKKWKTEKKLTMSKKGAFHYSDKPNQPGVRHYRVVVPKAGKVKAGTSKAVTVTVYRWQSLTKVKARKNEGTYAYSKVSFNAVDYAPALSGLPYVQQGSIDWNLEKQCTKVRARFGNTDDSDDLATAAISVVGDGTSLYDKTFGLTESEERTIDITGVFRLAFRWSSANPEGTPENQSGAVAGFGVPEVLCAF